MATFLFIMIVLALLALVVTLVVFTLSQRKKGPAAKSARQLPRPLPGITGFHTDFDRITLP